MNDTKAGSKSKKGTLSKSKKIHLIIISAAVVISAVFGIIDSSFLSFMQGIILLGLAYAIYGIVIYSGKGSGEEPSTLPETSAGSAPVPEEDVYDSLLAEHVFGLPVDEGSYCSVVAKVSGIKFLVNNQTFNLNWKSVSSVQTKEEEESGVYYILFSYRVNGNRRQVALAVDKLLHRDADKFAAECMSILHRTDGAQNAQ